MIPNGEYACGEKMITNKDKRSIVLAATLGDGSLFYTNLRQRLGTGGFCIKHGHKQLDYLTFKRDLIQHVVGRKINVLPAKSYVKALNKTYDQYRIFFQMKRFKAWRKFCYPANKKSLKKILPFVKHNEIALALWFMDDGTVMKGSRAGTNNFRTASGLILYLGDVINDDVFFAQKWFEDNFGLKPKIKWQKMTYKGEEKCYPQLNFNVIDALIIWQIIGSTVNKIPSMKHKFHGLNERSLRSDLLQPQTRVETTCEDIVQELMNDN